MVGIMYVLLPAKNPSDVSSSNGKNLDKRSCDESLQSLETQTASPKVSQNPVSTNTLLIPNVATPNENIALRSPSNPLTPTTQKPVKLDLEVSESVTHQTSPNREEETEAKKDTATAFQLQLFSPDETTPKVCLFVKGNIFDGEKYVADILTVQMRADFFEDAQVAHFIVAYCVARAKLINEARRKEFQQRIKKYQKRTQEGSTETVTHPKLQLTTAEEQYERMFRDSGPWWLSFSSERMVFAGVSEKQFSEENLLKTLQTDYKLTDESTLDLCYCLGATKSPTTLFHKYTLKNLMNVRHDVSMVSSFWARKEGYNSDNCGCFNPEKDRNKNLTSLITDYACGGPLPPHPPLRQPVMAKPKNL